MKLEGRVTLITGAGSGIGRAIALRFAAEGARVIVNDLNVESAQKTVSEMGATKEKARAIRADVSDSAQVRAMFAEVASNFGTLDVLVNNAGISEVGPSKHDEINRKGEAQLGERMMGGDVQTHWDITQNMTDEEWHGLLGVHLNGTFFCTREALKLMSKKNRGSIINMSSVAALRGIAVAPHYGAAKGGILSLTRSLALEVASRNIRVNAICPGWIETPMTQDFSPMMKMAIASQIPLPRFGQPEDVAGTALFLASDDSSYFTGQWLSPNGGLFIG
ncbi:MAG TPA: SDR family NAD(P)-dependent oxidoreductase [Candidatus Acidoferrales bacterium]|nr:SDR family NAD(P)-dependent oxidoreductase [Candidatus Acidoferrales bacterium]